MKADPAIAALGVAIADAIDPRFVATAARPVAGGCIHTALEIEGEGSSGKRRFFAKLNEASHADLFAAEADGLEALAKAGVIEVPKVVARGADDDHAWLVLEWLDLEPLHARAASALGAALARQHRLGQPRFGWERDNFIGASPQKNGWSDDWLAFWRERRLMFQLQLAARNRFPSRMIDRGERLAADCEAFFRGYAPHRSLLHGDLWSGNAAARADGIAVVFDPAVYVGDREADIAMTELFGGFPAAFKSAYVERWPLDDGYRTRAGFYNLYHLLNHANLFAGGYVAQSAQAIERLLAEIG